MVVSFRQSAFAFPIAAVAVLAMVLISEASYSGSRRAMDELSAISTARFQTQRLLRLLVDAETAQRGYLITGRAEYQAPYLAAMQELPSVLNPLRAHYGARPTLAPVMAHIDVTIAEKISELKTTLQLYDQGRHEAWREITATNIGKEKMDSIRAGVIKMVTDETQLAEQERVRVYETLLINRLGISTLAALSLLALFMYLRKARDLQTTMRSQQLSLLGERDRLDAMVKERTEDLTDLSRHLETAREDERARLARDLHDELGAVFTAAKLLGVRIKTRISKTLPESNHLLVDLNQTLNAGIELKRRIIEDLRPSSLADLGLVPTLEILITEFAKRVEITVQSDLQAVKLGSAAELTVYRLVQEALTNAAKYAKATELRVTLAAQGDVARITVADNGVGFVPAARKASTHGLLGMRYRVEAVGGTLDVTSAPGQGTCISAILPILKVPIEAAEVHAG